MIIKIDVLRSGNALMWLLDAISDGKLKVITILPSQFTDEFEQIIKERGLKKHTKNTITDIDELKKELKQVRSNGYAFDDQEVRLGVRRIAAPIFDHSNQLAGVIGIAGPTFRVRKDRVDNLGVMVKQVAKNIFQGLSERAEESQWIEKLSL